MCSATNDGNKDKHKILSTLCPKKKKQELFFVWFFILNFRRNHQACRGILHDNENLECVLFDCCSVIAQLYLWLHVPLTVLHNGRCSHACVHD